MGHRLYLLRHGETEWSLGGRHTGLTDIPLTPHGQAQAWALRPVLAGLKLEQVLCSPLRRARETAELAGLDDVTVDPDLVEWDYGGYEGLTTEEIREHAGASWTIFGGGVVPGITPGETIDQVRSRAQRVLHRIGPLLTNGDVVLVAHGHVLRILATAWLGVAPELGAMFLLDAGSWSVLDHEHDVPAIRAWNVVTGLPDGPRFPGGVPFIESSSRRST